VLPELAQQELLHTVAEVSAAFVGFSLVVGLFSDTSSESYRFYALRDVAIVSLFCLGGALIPSVIHGFDVGTEPTWRLASGAFSVAWIAAALWGIATFRRAVPASQPPRYLWFGPVSAILGNLLLVWNAVFLTRGGSPLYVTALMLLLVFAALSFVAAVFHGRSPGSSA
jgi:hypothetical protein